MLRLSHLFLAAGLVYCAAPLVAVSQEDDGDDEYRSGLVVEYRQAGHSPIRTLVPRPLIERRSAPPDARLTAGPYQAVWTGSLETDGEDTYRFAAYVRGRLLVKLGDQVVLQGDRAERGWLVGPRVKLPYDWLDFRIEYQAPSEQAELRLFWQGSQFSVEPLPQRIFSHEIEATVDDRFLRGESLVRTRRCAACHEIPGTSSQLAAPSLQHVGHTLRSSWILERLTQARPKQAPTGSPRTMPYYELPQGDAEDLVAYLWSGSTKPKSARPKWKPRTKGKRKKQPPASVAERTRRELAQGRRLVLSLGCLACHRYRETGGTAMSPAPRLDRLARKRPPSFFLQWLADPASLQVEHRMPVFDLTKEEAMSISRWLSETEVGEPLKSDWKPSRDAARIAHGKQLFSKLGCANCHSRGGDQPRLANRSKPATFNAEDSCINGQAEKKQTHLQFLLSVDDRAAVANYLRALPRNAVAGLKGEQLIGDHNCLECHRRGQSEGIAPTLSQVGGLEPSLAARIPAMTPPPLDSVGDKLTDEALRAAIERKHEPLRPYLDVRMPRFRLAQADVEALVSHFVAEDRIPDDYPLHPRQAPAGVDAVSLKTAGARLVTSDGFGCTSCHAVGGVLPPETPLNARGPELTQPAKRIRAMWFHRWVSNPSRIVPRMEMPGVKVPVHGVLEGDLQRQLAAVWEVLNLPDFTPPAPNPVRTLRQSGTIDQSKPRSLFVTDVVRHDGKSWIKPLLIGLPNRHNVMFDFAQARQQFWTTGDVARQRTEGKTWYWELGGAVVVAAKGNEPELELRRGDTVLRPMQRGQFVAEFDVVSHDFETGGLRVEYGLWFELPGQSPFRIDVTQSWHVGERANGLDGFRREISVRHVPAGWRLHFRPFPGQVEARRTGHGTWFQLPGPTRPAAELLGSPPIESTGAGWLLNDGEVAIAYSARIQVDQFPFDQPEPLQFKPLELHVLPGFATTRLAFPEEIMPTALAWRPDGSLVFSSLKGRVWLAQDRDNDGLEESLWPATDELAAPYGLYAGPDYLDVINKYALLRLTDIDNDGRYDRYETIASGWGHTTDYHDWAVGLPRDEQGAYYVALPCQQDERSQVSARYRGKVLRLVPREPTAADPRRFSLQVLSGGHRFPMGIARNRDGELFVTDNQGNYNPFNELNHVLPGKRYGFYNALEKKAGLQAPTTPPAIKIPHPWTRSVNGICFLDTPGRADSTFGPFAGNLVGCEFNERALVRMTLEKIGGVIQGAVYPFTWREPLDGPPLLGPVVAAVSPSGDLYIGCLRDSGWGGANNIGSIVKCRPQLEQLPSGIVRVRIAPEGFQLDFARALDRKRALEPKHFAISSYTRTPTPAYGGPDQNRRNEPIESVELSRDGKTVTLSLKQPLRPGYVYEFHLQNLTPHATEKFFPVEAHYTVLKVPPR